MAKLDDFGRPIYETAEEFNQAHRRGSTRTYESADGDTYQHKTTNETYRKQSVAQRHATVQGSKNAKKAIMIVAGFLILFNLLIVFTILNSVGVFEDSYVEYEEESWPDRGIVDSGEIYGDSDTPLPEGFETFTYNGMICTLPMTFEEVLETGLTLEGYDESVLFPRNCEEYVTLDDGENTAIVQLYVDNHKDEDILMGKARVVSFLVINPRGYDEYATIPHFTFVGGLTLESTYDEVVEVFGEATYNYYEQYDTGELLDQYEWYYYDGNDTQHVAIQFLDGVIQYVQIEITYGEQYEA